jgi:hypothetical protein
MSRGWWWLVLALGACSPYRKPLLQGTFEEVCPGGNPEVATLRFNPNHGFDYAYPDPADWTAGDDETWRLRGDTLIVTWNDGFAVARYALDRRKGDEAPGVSTVRACVSTAHLRFAGPRSGR